MTTLKSLYKDVFGEDRQQENFKYEPHVFDTNLKAGGKQYCRRCGLVALNNEFSNWAVRNGCLNELHQSYVNKRRLTNR